MSPHCNNINHDKVSLTPKTPAKQVEQVAETSTPTCGVKSTSVLRLLPQYFHHFDVYLHFFLHIFVSASCVSLDM